MKILFIYRHYWPDSPPYASMLRSIGRYLVSEGHTVHVWTELPTYQDVSVDIAPGEVLEDGEPQVTRLNRLPMWGRFKLVRQLDKIFFPVRILAKAASSMIFGNRYDYVVSATMPPVISGVCGSISAKLLKAKFIYHFQDIYPEVGSSAALWKKDGCVERLLKKIDGYSCRAAYRIIVLSHDMELTLHKRSLGLSSIVVINNFLLENFNVADNCEERGRSLEESSNVKAIFAGNIGRFQGLDTLVEAVNMLEDEVEFSIKFLGDGVMLDSLKCLAQGNEKIVFESRLPFNEAQREISTADIGVVALEPEIYKYAYPSKTLSYLGLGLPLILIVEKQSKMVEQLHSEGVCVFPDDRSAIEIAAMIRELCGNKNRLREMKKQVPGVYRKEYSREHVMSKWRDLITGDVPHKL